MRALLLSLLLLLAVAKPAQACKCGGGVSEEGLAQHVVFAGRVVETTERRPSKPPSGDSAMNAAARIVVEYSRDVPVGASVVVLGNHYSDCSVYFGVGGRGLVVASRFGEFLTTSKCSYLADDVVKAKVRAKLGIPADYGKIDITPRPPEGCARPATLDEAFAAADAIVSSSPRSACEVPGTDEVEQIAVMRWGWKGASAGELLHLRIKGHPWLAYDDFPFWRELLDATHIGDWPPGEFLRRDGELFVNDGCLNPHAPASLEVGTEAVKRLFSLPKDYHPIRWIDRNDEPLPRLSCTTLEQSLFERADQIMSELRRAAEAAPSPAPSRAEPTVAPPRSGSCAGCALVERGDAPEQLAWLLACVGVAFVRVKVRRHLLRASEERALE